MLRLSPGRIVPFVRIFLGFLIAAVALGGAVWLHGNAKLDHHASACVAFNQQAPGGGYFVPSNPCNLDTGGTGSFQAAYDRKAGWQDAVAVVLAVAGVGAGVALVAGARSSRQKEGGP